MPFDSLVRCSDTGNRGEGFIVILAPPRLIGAYHYDSFGSIRQGSRQRAFAVIGVNVREITCAVSAKFSGEGLCRFFHRYGLVSSLILLERPDSNIEDCPSSATAQPSVLLLVRDFKRLPPAFALIQQTVLIVGLFWLPTAR